MKKSFTLEQVYLMVVESLFNLGIDRNRVTLDKFIFWAKRVMRQWGDEVGFLTGNISMSGGSSYTIPGIIGVVTAYNGDDPVQVVDEGSFELLQQRDTLLDDEYIMKWDKNGHIEFFNVGSTDTVVASIVVSLDDLTEEAAKISFPDIDEYVLYDGVMVEARDDFNLPSAQAQMKYESTFAQNARKQKDLIQPNVIYPQGYLE